MKIKNFKYDKKKIASFLLAFGIGVTSSSLADFVSYNSITTLRDGRSANLYFATGSTDSDYAYVSFDNMTGYIPLSEVNHNLLTNNEYSEMNTKMMIGTDIAYLYQMPDFNQKVITTLKKNDNVQVIAKNNNDWYVIVTDNGLTGFVHASSFIKKIMMAQIKGNNVNIRTSPSTSTKKNITGSAYIGDRFPIISREGDWYLIDYDGKNAYVYADYVDEVIVIENDKLQEKDDMETVKMVKVTGNNVNIRTSPTTNTQSNIIGFADITDYFKIINQEGDWYLIDYLGTLAYINASYVKEVEVKKEDLVVQKIGYLKEDTNFYSDTNGSYMSCLPKYQSVSMIKEEKGYLKIRVDGVVGYINKNSFKPLTERCVVIDLGRQIVRVFNSNKEVYRAHMISGRKSMQTNIGVFKIGHRLTDYQLTKSNHVDFWIQFDNNIGLHDADWQDTDNFIRVARDSYNKYAKGEAVTYPSSYGSHGCANLAYEDAEMIYSLIRVGDNVLVIGPNDLIKDNILSFLNDLNIINENEKVKKLVL